MNVVIWARVSSREQREGYSIDAQLRFNRDRAQANGWHVIREFVVAESAKWGADRVVFNQMMAWVKTNAKREKIKAILSHKLDRVCRNMRDAVRLQELEDACGVQLAFVDNQFGPGAAGAHRPNRAQVHDASLPQEIQPIKTKIARNSSPRIKPETSVTSDTGLWFQVAAPITDTSLGKVMREQTHVRRMSSLVTRMRRAHAAHMSFPKDLLHAVRTSRIA